MVWLWGRGTTTAYSWGNSASQAGDYAWYDKNAYEVGRKYAHSVGGKKANPWGLHDMHGNVREWVEDCWHKNYKGAPAKAEQAWTSANGGDCEQRVVRGGAWDDNPSSLRSAFRIYDWPTNRNLIIGFRLVQNITS